MSDQPALEDHDLLRYSRQLFLPQVDVAGQLAWLHSHVLIVGLGGLGSIAALLLAGSGVGHLTLVDSDQVELSNIGRQIAYTMDSIGQPKVEAIQQAIQYRNDRIQVTPVVTDFSDAIEHGLDNEFDVVLDCTDNFKVRYQINQYCQSQSIPLVSGAAIGMQGQLAVFDFLYAPSPCYHCLYPDLAEVIDSCSESGVLNPVPNMIGAIQVSEALKLLLPNRLPVEAALLRWDAMASRMNRSVLVPDVDCEVCHHRA